MQVRGADYLLYVVEDFSSVDQRAVHRLGRALRAKRRGFAELIVVHNMRTVTEESTLRHAWGAQVTSLYGTGEQHTSSVLVADSGGTLVRRDVTWFKTAATRHLLLAQHASPIGELHNSAAVALLMQWIASAYLPTEASSLGRPSLLRQLLQWCEQALSDRLKQPVELIVQPSTDPSVRFIRATIHSVADAVSDDPPPETDAGDVAAAGGAKPGTADAAATGDGAAAGKEGAQGVPQSVAAEPGGSSPTPARTSTLAAQPRLAQPQIRLITQNHHWRPAVDYSQGMHSFTVLVDLPGLVAKDIKVSRSGACVCVRGARTAPYAFSAGTEVVRSERSFGSFELLVHVPDQYLRRFDSCQLRDGIMRITFPRDEDEEDVIPDGSTS